MTRVITALVLVSLLCACTSRAPLNESNQGKPLPRHSLNSINGTSQF